MPGIKGLSSQQGGYPAQPVGSVAGRILVLGGTSFAGRAIVTDALRTGAEITLFGRGRTGTDLFPRLTRLIGDRDTGDYSALRAGSWDAAVDVSGYVPRHVAQAMDALGDRAGRYLFISSHAVYQLAGVGPGSTEDTPPAAGTGHRRTDRRDLRPAQGRLPGRCDGPVRRAGDHRATHRTGSPTGCGGPPAAAGWRSFRYRLRRLRRPFSR